MGAAVTGSAAGSASGAIRPAASASARARQRGSIRTTSALETGAATALGLAETERGLLGWCASIARTSFDQEDGAPKYDLNGLGPFGLDLFAGRPEELDGRRVGVAVQAPTVRVVPRDLFPVDSDE